MPGRFFKTNMLLISALILTNCASSTDPNTDINNEDNTQTHSFSFATWEDALPAFTSSDQVIHHTFYSLKYNENHEQAEWVAYKLTSSDLNGSQDRTDNFRSDPDVGTGSASLNDYSGSGYDRGHLAPAGDMTRSYSAMSESFFLSNMSPQVPGFNRGIWKTLESYVRTWASNDTEIYIVTGPVLTETYPTIGSNQVSIPTYYYKTIIDINEPEIKAIGFILPNESGLSSVQSYAVTIDSVESLTGIDFFPGLPDSAEQIIESEINTALWQFTGYTAVIDDSQNDSDKTDSENITVYVSNSGTKYHLSGCRYLSSSKNPISLSEAKEEGYSPCSVCLPPIQ